ncbi:G-type lectin S-receptor-like serine/threonine-protein kinase SD2-5 isoform X2 [Phragmites australis]|uniref:G-type lectin S-receptor-like serine/threonine-protein kinase SD2-5 isoform X2 n=1 Tax=Phragmites australis TaxID=29695 RepID=UPI002D77D4C8|nr:G-type lectin S-receptor-like serine/threonine-protein kinase SD2-5 isoform X2 [Phragmites australis]
MTMQHFNMLMVILLLLGFPFHPIVAQLSTAAPPNLWEVSNMYNGAYVSQGAETPVIWSANPDNPVSQDAILNFTREGHLLLHDGDGTVIWSTATKSKSVAGMGLDVSGNLVLFDQNNSPVWQSFDHPTDTLVLGQSLCRGKSLRAKPSSTKWPGARVYFSAELDGLQYSFKPAAYTQLFQASPTSTYISTCYAFANGSFGFPDTIFSLPSARSQLWVPRFMRLESDGHLRLYEMGQMELLMVLDVLSIAMNFCDYPLACGDYGVCSNAQCSCPSLSYFRFQNERHPGDGCIPLRSISCHHAHNHRLIPLDNVSYFSHSTFVSLATPGSENVCKQSCLIDCSCKAVLYQSYGPGSDSGYCMLLSEQNLILFSGNISNPIPAFIKIQDKRSEQRRIIIAVGSTIAGFSLTSILVCAVVWKKCKKDEEQLFDGIPGIPKRFPYGQLKVATSDFSVKLGGGGFGSVFKGKIGKETIAVKRLEGVEQGMEEFLAEVMTIGRTHHFNLVRLVGFCAEKSHRLLVYEYLSNGSLDKWIFHTSPVFTLSWKTRRNIIIAIARSLSYLHEECKEKIAHLDIKPQNILLDDKFNAKLSDFGLSKMINRDQSKVMTRMRGTRGYLAPEWLGSKITEKADIYSFGIVMMEIICGRENLDESQPEESIHLISLLQEKARSGQLFDLVDSGSNDMKLHMEEVMETMKLAMWSLQVDSSRRPLMSTVVKVLEGVMSLEATPDCTFVASFASSNTDVVGSGSSYVPSESHLSAPR